MLSQFEILEAEVLKLVPAERARLAEQLIASLDADDEIEAAWAVEVERRIAEIDSGAVQGLSLTEVTTQARASLK